MVKRIDTEAEFNAILADLERIGFPPSLTPGDFGIQLPTGAEMLERAKAKEAATTVQEPQAATVTPLHPRPTRVRSAALVAASFAAIAGVLFISPKHHTAATADTPPVLDFEFVKARDIAWASGKEARPQLLKLAAAAAASPEEQYSGTTQYVASNNWFAEITVDPDRTWAVLRPIRRESWLHADNSMSVREESLDPLRPDGRTDLKVAHGAAPGHTVIEHYPVGEGLYAKTVEDLGTDPDTIRNTLLDYTECDTRKRSLARTGCLFDQVTGYVTNWVVPHKSLEAFWLMLADEKGLRDLGTVQDREGRPGVGISFIDPEYDDQRKIVIVSPKTGEILGTETILIKPDKDLDIDVPAIYSFTAYLSHHMTTEQGPQAPTK